MIEAVYTDHLKGRKVLLETPSGFAMFLVKEFAFQQEKNIWVHFSDPEYAIQVLVALGFRKVGNRTTDRNCNGRPPKALMQLICKFCKTGDELIVQDENLKASIEKNLVRKITCVCDGYIVDEVMWGIKNVLHEFIHEEGCNITPEYSLPVSKGLQEALLYYSVNIPPEALDKTFISKFGFLRYLDLNLERFPKELSRSFDEYIGIGDAIQNGLDYAKVLALVLVPELVEEYGFTKTFSPELALKFERAKMFQQKRADNLTMTDIQKIMGILNYLLNVPELKDKVLMDVKLMEAKCFSSLLSQKVNKYRAECGLDAINVGHVGKPVNFNHFEFRKVLLKTPSGFAMFNVHRDVFSDPKNIWKYFSDIIEARNVAVALGFARVDHSVVRDISPGDELRHLILRLCKANEELVVQDKELKAVIESKLNIKCWIGDRVVDELIWGLNFLLPCFIPEEKDTVPGVFPLSEQLLEDLKTYGINVSTSKINAVVIYLFGYMSIVDTLFKTACKNLHAEFDKYFCRIDFMEDDLSYAWKIAKILIPGSDTEIRLAEITGNWGSKPTNLNLSTDAGKIIANYDRQDSARYLERLLEFHQTKRQAQNSLHELLDQNTIEDQIGEIEDQIGERLDQNTIEDQIGEIKDQIGEIEDQIGERLDQMTLEDQIGATPTASCGEDDKQLTVEGVGGKDKTPAVGKKSQVKKVRTYKVVRPIEPKKRIWRY